MLLIVASSQMRPTSLPVLQPNLNSYIPIIPTTASAISNTPFFDTLPPILVAADVLLLKDPSEFNVPSHQIPLV
jgi:hypothetical protein